MLNAVIIDKKDNVAVAIEPINKGSEVKYKFDGEIKNFIANEDITIYHKVAISKIKAGDAIIKYGEHIGRAARDIEIGEHLHTHNIENHREEL